MYFITCKTSNKIDGKTPSITPMSLEKRFKILPKYIEYCVNCKVRVHNLYYSHKTLLPDGFILKKYTVALIIALNIPLCKFNEAFVIADANVHDLIIQEISKNITNAA